MNFDLGQLSDFQVGELEQIIERATETVATNTWDPDTRSIFSPENLDYRAKILVPSDTPLRNRFPRTQGLGQAASWFKMTSKLNTGAVDGTNTTIFLADGDEPSETSQTYVAATQSYQILGRKIAVGVKHVAASRGRPQGLGTVLDDRTNIKMLEVMIGEEQAIIAADSDVSNNFDGILKQITTNSGTFVLTTASGLQPHLETLYNAGAPAVDMFVANPFQMRALAADLEKSGSIQRIIIDNQGGTVAGARVRAIINEIDGNEVEMVTSRYVGATAMLLTTRTPAGENCIEVEDLVPLSMIDKDLSGLVMTRYIFEISAVKVIHEPWQMEFAGLATS